MNEKLCVKCSSSEISPEGIYCKELDRWVGRCSEQQCMLGQRNEQYEAELKADEEREDFRCISVGQITPIETTDGFNPEPNWDAFPENFGYAVFDIGRE